MGGRVVRESLEVGDEEGRDGKLLLLPGEPKLILIYTNTDSSISNELRSPRG